MKLFLTWIEKFISVITICLFISMTLVVFSQVILRYGFGSNIYWAEEFGRYSMVWIAFLGAAVGVRYNEHTRIDFFIKLLPVKALLVVEIFNKILMIFFVVFISYSSITMMENMLSLKTPSLQIPVGLVHLVLPIAGIVMVIYLVTQIIQLIQGKGNSDKGGEPIG